MARGNSGYNIFQSLLSTQSSVLGLAKTASNAALAVGEAKAAGYEGNAQLLRFDANNYRSVGQDVFKNEIRQGLQRVASAGSQYVAGGVQLSGSAGAVMSDIQRESQKEAQAQYNQYEYQARRSAMQADIAQYQAGLERQAAGFQAQTILQQAQADFEKSMAQYLAQSGQTGGSQYGSFIYRGSQAGQQAMLSARGGGFNGSSYADLVGQYKSLLGLGS